MSYVAVKYYETAAADMSEMSKQIILLTWEDTQKRRYVCHPT